MASFIDASTASGVCSHWGIVRTAFALAAAARKSSTVFSAAGRFKGSNRAKTTGKVRVRRALTSCLRSAAARQATLSVKAKGREPRRATVKCKFFMRKGLFDWESEDCVEASIGKVKTRLGKTRCNFPRLPSLSSQGRKRHDCCDREISPRVHSDFCRNRPDRTDRDLYGSRHQLVAAKSKGPSASRNLNRPLCFDWIYLSWQDHFCRAWDNGGGFSSWRRPYFTRARHSGDRRFWGAGSWWGRRLWSGTPRNATYCRSSTLNDLACSGG